MLEKKVVIIGGGLAGLTCAIHLLKIGHPVTLIEKIKYPSHKVCGEFISNEVRSYLGFLGIDINAIAPVEINKFAFSSSKGRTIFCNLPLGGFGISRFKLDHLLYETALSLGCKVLHDAVESIDFNDNVFHIHTKENDTLLAGLAIGAFGKRSTLDQKLGRSFFNKKSNWLAVKAHYRGNITSDQVALHNFDGGYCGISKVENDLINVCYLTDYTHFKAFKNIDDFQQKVLCKNPELKAFFESSDMVFDHPITISQVSFAKKSAVEKHILMIGDTAGLIHPLCGNGMAMAIHSAKLCAELCDSYLKNSLKSRSQLEEQYTNLWKATFHKRLLMGRILSHLLRNRNITNVLLDLMAKFPSILLSIIKNTHGKPIM
ncbi:MAG: NAD(P)/FAD-dependent oxidoreductase [Flavobacterium sp.]|nr:MAG: NAD(P)/FAD-dependent oxidoreductase [Flavobacterium sp.]